MSISYDEQHLVATAEWMNLHVDLEVRRVAPWPDMIRELIAKYVAKQGRQPWPDEAGKTMNIEKPLFTARTDVI
ncbi:MAG: hypothetical protein KJO27_03265 [Gammaproteobacteria bacterium]|nr:hypothetical protein [Gammaproteobacteria bacterium]